MNILDQRHMGWCDDSERLEHQAMAFLPCVSHYGSSLYVRHGVGFSNFLNIVCSDKSNDEFVGVHYGNFHTMQCSMQL